MSFAEQEWLLGVKNSAVQDFFAELGIILPARQGYESPVRCFSNPGAHNHDDKTASCSVNLLTGLWKCQACGAQGNAFNAAQVLGCSDRRAGDLARKYGLFMTGAGQPEDGLQKPKLPGEVTLRRWRKALRQNPRLLARLRDVKGWEPRAVVRLGLGWDGERIIIPIRDERHRIGGVVRYLPGGKPKMLAMAGTRRNLFPTPELIRRKHPLFLVEGEGTAVALWSLGFRTVGVPGAGSWRSEWGQRLYGRRVIMLPDCDPQGRALAERMVGDVPNMVVVDICPARSDGYDVADALLEARADGGVAQVVRVLERFAL